MISTYLTLLMMRGGDSIIDVLRADAKSLESFVSTPLAKDFLSAVDTLPDPGMRTIYGDTKTKRYYATFDDVPTDSKTTAKAVERDGQFYYYTKYGTPLAYVRPVDLLGSAGLDTFKGKKVCDFGYGGIGPLRLIANLGGEAVGVDVDSMLRALYSKPEDTGKIVTNGIEGKIQLVEGFFPTDAATVQAIGGDYDVFLSKNTLKRGYVHPEKPIDKRLTVDLGVSDDEFCKDVAKVLKPGGLFLIYNLSPSQNPPDKPYLPWADGRCPFTREALEGAGFEVFSFDVVDDGPARDMGARLGWDKGPNGMHFEKDLFGYYTLARKRK